MLITGCATAKPTASQSPATSYTVSLFDGKTLDGWVDQENKGTAAGWMVTNGVITSTGAGRGTLYTKEEFGNYRVTFLMRHLAGGHQACVLIYCRPPQNGGKALDALGGVQFQVPNGGHWDYRPTENGVKHNNGGGKEFTTVNKGNFKVAEWSQVEILVNTNGTARMAVAQPPGTKAKEILDFNDPTAGRIGAFALQMHQNKLDDEYKDIRIEVNPTENKLITTE